MRTRSQSRRRRQQQTPPFVVENFDLEEPIVDQNIIAMADNRTMAQMLQAPIEGYEDAIVVPPINANNFELKQPLINLVQSNKFTGRQDPHNHLRFFNKVTSTFRHPEVPNTSIKLLLFPFSLDGEARDCQKFITQRSRANDSRVSTDVPLSNSSPSNNSFDIQQLAASLEDKMTEYEYHLPSQTVTNPRQQINAITTRSGKTLEEPSTALVPTPDVSIPSKEPEQNPETSTEKVQNPNLENIAHVLPLEEEESIFMEIPKPKAKKTVNVEIQDLNSYPSKLPYPERMKVRENDKPSAQHSRFLKMFKQLRLEIGLKDALVEMPKFNKWLSSLLRNKEKLEEIAITTVNAECSAIIMNKVPEKLEDPGKFLIPCALQELNRTSALANSGASINLLPHSIYKKLGLEALTPTRMTLELPIVPLLTR
ncbi:reverse transcriptase domain-containing protein [Tanacetum coccineum]